MLSDKDIVENLFSAEKAKNLLKRSKFEEIEGRVLLFPFDENSLNPSSYDLRVGKEAILYSTGQRISVETQGELIIQPKELVGIITLEFLGMPHTLVGVIQSKVSLVIEGIYHISTRVDPGYYGYIMIKVFNAGNNNIRLQYKQKLCSLSFVKLASPASSKGIKYSVNYYHDLERERSLMLDEIERLKEGKDSLMPKFDKSVQERELLRAISNMLKELNQKLDKHDEKMEGNLQELQKQIWKAASQTIDTVSKKLEEQNANLALEVIKGNRKLFELIEATSIALKSEIDVQKDQLEQISGMLELSNEHLSNILSVLDGEPDETKTSLKDKIIEILKEAGGEAAKNQEEIKGLLNEVFDLNANKGGRLSALKDFFGKAKNWIQKHPKVVMALRVMLTGAMTAMGVPVPGFD